MPRHPRSRPGVPVPVREQRVGLRGASPPLLAPRRPSFGKERQTGSGGGRGRNFSLSAVLPSGGGTTADAQPERTEGSGQRPRPCLRVPTARSAGTGATLRGFVNAQRGRFSPRKGRDSRSKTPPLQPRADRAGRRRGTDQSPAERQGPSRLPSRGLLRGPLAAAGVGVSDPLPPSCGTSAPGPRGGGRKSLQPNCEGAGWELGAPGRRWAR